MHGARHGIVRLEHGRANIIFAGLLEFHRIELAISRSDLATIRVKIKIDFDWGHPSLAAAEASNPDIAVNHLMFQNGVLASVSARCQAADVSRVRRSALLVGANRIAVNIRRLLLGERLALLFAVFANLHLFQVTLGETAF